MTQRKNFIKASAALERAERIKEIRELKKETKAKMEQVRAATMQEKK